MRKRCRSPLVLALVVLTQLSCATTGGPPETGSMPAARLALPDEQRVFFDALQGYGDWLLIEPLGYVFRPYDSDRYWHPYLHGYWAPSAMYGWVWISGEPYGWATYHYGAWYRDDYQGWVWLPGSDWGPAWVSWVMSDDYVGWAPLFPPGYAPDLASGGAYLYVPLASLASSDLQQLARTGTQVGEALGTLVTVDNLRQQDGVVFNAGPDIGLVERRAGPLARVRLEDLSPAPEAGAPRPAAAVRRSGEEAARQARAVTQRGDAPPPTVGVLRPDLGRGRARRPLPAAPRGTAADSTKRP